MTKNIYTLRDEAIGKFNALMERSEILSHAFSSGKDSSTSLNLWAEAALRRVRAGKTVPVTYVCHGDTKVENPLVRIHADERLYELQEFGKVHGIDIRVRVAQPNLMSEYPVRIVSGRRLPTFANRQARRCSVDLKIAPMQRVMNDVKEELARAGRPMPVTVLGTRFEESVRRASAMNARGEGAHMNVVTDDAGRVTSRTFAPIAEWTELDVWEYLASVGPDREFEGFVKNFDRTVEIYADAAGECVIVASSEGTAGRSTACGARHGCHLCTAVGSDNSMENMLKHARHAHMRGCNALRNWLVNTQADYSRRRWIGRKMDPVTGHIPIIAADYDARTTEFLLGAMLTLDRREAERAKRFAALVAQGREMEDDGYREIIEQKNAAEKKRAMAERYKREMVEPQFCYISLPALIAIDFCWSQDALHAPFHALWIYDQVMNKGVDVEIPSVKPILVAPRPKAFYLDLKDDTDERVSVHGAMADTFAGACSLHTERPERGEYTLPDGTIAYGETGRWQQIINTRDVPALDVDEESAQLIMHFELQSLLRIHDAFNPNSKTQTRTRAASFYLRYGVVAPGLGRRGEVESMIRRGQVWERAGVAGQISFDAVKDRVISEAEHCDLKEKLIAERAKGEGASIDPRVARRLASLGEAATPVLEARARMRAELPYVFSRIIALTALKAKVQASGGEWERYQVEGRPAPETLRLLRRQARVWKAFALDGEQAMYLRRVFLRLEAQAEERAIEVLIAGEDSVLRFAYRFGIAMPFDNTEARISAHKLKAKALRMKIEEITGKRSGETSRRHEEQLELFAAHAA